MSNNKKDFCQWPRCSRESGVIYYGQGLCDKHWNKGSEMSCAELKKKLGIREPTAEKTEENGKSESRESGIVEKAVEVVEKIDENK